MRRIENEYPEGGASNPKRTANVGGLFRRWAPCDGATPEFTVHYQARCTEHGELP